MLSKLCSWQLLGKNEFRDFKNFGSYVTAHQILVARNNLVQMATRHSLWFDHPVNQVRCAMCCTSQVIKLTCEFAHGLMPEKNDLFLSNKQNTAGQIYQQYQSDLLHQTYPVVCYDNYVVSTNRRVELSSLQKIVLFASKSTFTLSKYNKKFTFVSSWLLEK